ncbi:conserved hypothetical protein [Ricinus communis]|uniref:Uncharacterized protein n=1 Tax=Ricinus communis TaxID=3988 RepID=B9SR65_RICCO|nr:conserved hypothetical protein [Ricinus communis]
MLGETACNRKESARACQTSIDNGEDEIESESEDEFDSKNDEDIGEGDSDEGNNNVVGGDLNEELLTVREAAKEYKRRKNRQEKDVHVEIPLTNNASDLEEGEEGVDIFRRKEHREAAAKYVWQRIRALSFWVCDLAFVD